MTELDPSLLTDEEQHAFKVWATDRGHLADEIQRALIAARAENKRKDEMLRKALDTLIWASGAFQSEKESSAWSRFGLPVVNDLRALLQSEKGGE